MELGDGLPSHVVHTKNQNCLKNDLYKLMKGWSDRTQFIIHQAVCEMWNWVLAVPRLGY